MLFPQGICSRICSKSPIPAGDRDDALLFRPCWPRSFVPFCAAIVDTLRSPSGFTFRNRPSGRSLNNLDRFIQSVGARRFYYELLIDRPELVPRLTALFAASRFLSG